MAYLSLYRKYRPQTFTEILGQEHVAQTLSNAVDEDRVAHAYLFTGPRGTGKTSTARILAKALNCEQGPTSKPCGKCASCLAIAAGSSLDVFEMDAASHSGVDDTREILFGVALATAGGRKKVYVIDEVHMLTAQSFNALLKTLEEPPDHVIFVLATTEAHKVLPTIVSRTQRFDFRRVPASVIEQHLAEIAKEESIDIEPDALALVARHAEGSVRDALSALDQLSSFGHAVGEADVESLLGTRDEETFVELFDAIAQGDVGTIFTTMQRFVAQGADMRQLADDALEHTRSLLLLKTAPEAEALLDVPAEDRPRLGVQAEAFSTDTLLRTLDLIGQAVIDMRNAPNHRLLLEIALVRSAAPETDPSATGLLGRIERLERRIGIDTSEAAAAGPSEAAAAGAEAPPERTPTPSAPPAASTSSPARKKPSTKPTAKTTGTTGTTREDVAPPAADSKPSSSKGGAASAAAPAAVSGTVGLGEVKDAWPAVMKEVNKGSKRVGAYLNPSKPVSFDGDVLVVSTQSEFHAHQMTEQKNKSVLVEAVFAALGIKPKIEFTHAGADGTVSPDEDESVEETTETIETADEASPVEADDPVELVKRGLGAEVVEERSNQGAR